MSSNQVQNQPSAPWWKFGMVWMLIAGPAVVVVASFFTIYLAIARPDPLVSENYYKEGLEINETLRAQREQATSGSLMPAHQARNHAQTGGLAKQPAEEAAAR